MDLVNRYLSAIRWNLPRGVKADDIIAELGDVIASRIEDREEALDRPLTRAETSTLLRDFGHPLVVAARYGKQQWLIGPEIFPFYLFSLKIMLAICAAVIVIVAVIQTILARDGMMLTLVKNGGEAWWTLLGNAAIITLIFAVLERTGWLTEHLRRWKPEQLPDLPNLRFRPRSVWSKVFEIAFGVVFLLWWIGLIHLPLTYGHIRAYSTGRPLAIEPAPVWVQLYWPVLVVVAAHLVYNLIQLLRPRWRVVQALIGTATTLASLALIAALYRAGPLVTVLPGKLDPDRIAEIQPRLDQSIRFALLFMAAVWTWQWLTEMWRLSGARRG